MTLHRAPLALQPELVHADLVAHMRLSVAQAPLPPWQVKLTARHMLCKVSHAWTVMPLLPESTNAVNVAAELLNQ